MSLTKATLSSHMGLLHSWSLKNRSGRTEEHTLYSGSITTHQEKLVAKKIDWYYHRKG